MKKIYLSLLVFFISASVFAGGWFQDFSSEVIDIIDESDATTPPIDADWYFTGTTSTNFLGQKSVQTVWKNSTSWNLGTDSKPAGKFVYLNGTSGFLNGVAEFSLVSPAFTPVENASDLYYRIQEVKARTDGQADGAEELYLEVATKVEGVWTWTTSTDNVLAGLPGYNTSTTPVTVLQKSLSDKIGQEIKIRFRGKVDAGNFVAVIYGVALVDNAVTDLSVSTSQNISSQVPQKHANQVLNALVQNAGKPIAADVATVTATVTGYTATASVPALNPLETSAIAFATPFVPSFGNYQLRYVLSATGQAVNDTAFSNTFTITPNTFAADTGYVQGTAGSTTLDLGNKFTLAVEDSIESISIAWGKLSSNPTSSDFQLVIYALNADIVLGTEPVYVSGTFTRPDNATTLPNNRFATFESYPINKKLSAGDYVFAVRSTVNIGIGTNYDNNSVYYRIDKTTRQLTKTTGQYLLIRVNTASDITLAPAIGSKAAGINEPVVIAGSAVTGLAASPAITIKKADGTDVANIAASYADNKVTITHAAFEYNTAYTITVPSGAITGYASELTWSFTTAGLLKVGIFAPTNNAVLVALNAPVSVTFDRNIPASSSLEGITIKALKTDGSDSIAVENVSATKNGAVLTITHDDFARSTKYKVTVPATAIGELAADTSWVFTTVPPVGLATTTPFYPVRGAVDVSVTQSTVWVNFNQPIDTVSTAGITINGTPVTTVTLGSNSGTAKSRVTISTAGLTPFTEGTLYTVVIPAGAIAGYSEEITWSFTTFLTLAPVTFTPAKGVQTASVNTEISIEFNKNFNIQEYNQGTISITSAGGTALSGVTFAIDADNPKKLIISHTDPLLPDTAYTVNVSGNVVATYGGVSDWTFTAKQAGGWVQDFSSGRPDIYTSANESTAPDNAWYITGVAAGFFGTNSDWKTAWNFSTVEKPASSFIYLDGSAGARGTFSLVSPAFTPTSSESLYYRFQEIKVSPYGNSVPLEIYVEVATKEDGVWTWSTSTANILASLPDHNTATSATVISSTDISSYAGQEIKVRFRGKTGLGDFVAAFYNVAVLDDMATDLAVSASQSVISQVPQKHANQVVSASVQNLGSAVDADAATVAVSVAGTGTSVGTANVPALSPLETAALAFATPFVPQSFGDYRLQYVLSEDDNTANDTVFSNPFAITPNTFATDAGYVTGAVGDRYSDLGNKFTLTEKDRIESISVGWGKISSNPTTHDFQLLIYALDADGSLNTTPVYISDILSRPDNATTLPTSTQAPRLVTFETYPIELDSLEAGDYLFTVRSTVNIGVGTEENSSGVYYKATYETPAKEGAATLTSTDGLNLLIRVNTVSDVTLSPAVASQMAGINEPVVIAGTAITGLADSPAISIKKADGTDVANIAASYADGKVTITHAAFDYGSTYTVTVPANTITGYASELSWSFTTAGPLKASLFAPADNAALVALNAPVSVIFDRNIPTSSSLAGITIKALKTDGSDSTAVGNVSATTDGAVLTIAHDDFARSTKYKVTVPVAAISELAADTSWVFTTVPPIGLTTTSSLYPANEAYDVSLTQANVWVNFNQTIDTVSTAGITINNIPVTTVTLGSNSATGIAKSRVSISTAGFTPFTEGTLYTVVIPAGTIAGYNAEIRWSFTSYVATAVVDTLPKNNATNVFLGTEISVEFNKPVIKSTVPYPPVATIIAGTDTIDGVDYVVDTTNTKKVIISHTEALAPETEYTVTLPGSSVGAWRDTITWKFTTESAPEIVSFTPADDTVNVAVRNVVEVIFNKTVALGNTAGITINDVAPISVTLQSIGGTKNALRLNHAPFDQATEYTVRIPAGSVLGYNRDTTWSFTTVPVLTYTTSPANIAKGVALDAPLKIEFNRAPLRPRGFANISITGNNGEEITVTGSSWNTSTGSDTITISHAPFEYWVTYTVNVVATSIIDATDWSGDPSIIWSFETAPPTGLPELKDASGVYPTLTKGNITVVSEPGSLIKIVDIAGVVRATYRSTGKLSPIYLNGANGLYLVVVENGKSTLTYKAILQK